MVFLTANIFFQSSLFSIMMIANGDGLKHYWWLSEIHPMFVQSIPHDFRQKILIKIFTQFFYFAMLNKIFVIQLLLRAQDKISIFPHKDTFEERYLEMILHLLKLLTCIFDTKFVSSFQNIQKNINPASIDFHIFGSSYLHNTKVVAEIQEEKVNTANCTSSCCSIEYQ